MRLVLTLLVLLLAQVAPARAEEGGLDALYGRIAADLAAGEPLRIRVFVALCDNDSQGIVPVKNRSICRGDAPAQNIYWGTDGGLFGTLGRRSGYRLTERLRFEQGDVLERVTWRKSFRTGAALRARGAPSRFDVELTGIAYRGERIAVALRDFVTAVHNDVQDAHGQVPHVVGYIGHDYVLDIESAAELRGLHALARGTGTLHKGAFALSCFGEQRIRPLITRPSAHVLALHRNLTYPGAWTATGLVEGLAQGASAPQLIQLAAKRFADAMKRNHGAIVRSLAYGP